MASPPLTRWLAPAAAIAAAIGSMAHWGALSEVPSQADVVESTRWILAALCILAAGLFVAAERVRSMQLVAALLLLVAALLAWTERRYEGIQAFQYGVTSAPWGIHLVLAGALVGAASGVAGFVGSRGSEPTASG